MGRLNASRSGTFTYVRDGSEIGIEVDVEPPKGTLFAWAKASPDPEEAPPGHLVLGLGGRGEALRPPQRPRRGSDRHDRARPLIRTPKMSPSPIGFSPSQVI